MNDHLHPVFQDALASFCPPADNGQQQAQQRPDPACLPPLDNLRAGGYTREARLLEEAQAAIEQLIFCLESPKAMRFAATTIEIARSISAEIDSPPVA